MGTTESETHSQAGEEERGEQISLYDYSEREHENQCRFFVFLPEFSFRYKQDYKQFLMDFPVICDRTGMSPSELLDHIDFKRKEDGFPFFVSDVGFSEFPGVEWQDSMLEELEGLSPHPDGVLIFVPGIGYFGSDLHEIRDSFTEIFRIEYIQDIYLPCVHVSESIIDFFDHMIDEQVRMQDHDLRKEIMNQIDETKHTGRPPIGFKVVDGDLVPSDEFESVRSVLQLVDAGEISAYEGSEQIDASPRSVKRILNDVDRRDMYMLD